jgi:hypothetical protein
MPARALPAALMLSSMRWTRQRRHDRADCRRNVKMSAVSNIEMSASGRCSRVTH